MTTMVVLTLDALRAKRAEVQARLDALGRESDPFHVEGEYKPNGADVERARRIERMYRDLDRFDAIILEMTHRSMLSFGGTERYPRLGCAPDAGDDDELARETERAALLPDDAEFADDDPDLDGPMPLVAWCDGCGSVLTDAEASKGGLCAACIVADHPETEAA